MKLLKFLVITVTICSLLMSSGCVLWREPLILPNGRYIYDGDDIYFYLVVNDEMPYGTIRCDKVFDGKTIDVVVLGGALGHGIWLSHLENGERVKEEWIAGADMYYNKTTKKIKVEDLSFDIQGDGDPDEIHIDTFYMDAIEIHD